MEPRDIAARLNRLARQKGWSEQRLCKEAGIHIDTVRNMRTKNTMASARKLKALTGALDVRLDDLMIEPGAGGIAAPQAETPDSIADLASSGVMAGAGTVPGSEGDMQEQIKQLLEDKRWLKRRVEALESQLQLWQEMAGQSPAERRRRIAKQDPRKAG